MPTKGLEILKDALKVGESAKAPVPTTKNEKFKALEAVASVLDKQFSTTNSIVRLGAKVGIRVPCIATNIPSLDEEALGCGGIPRGRIIEIYGPESSGKTTLTLHIIAEEQANTDNLAAFVDAEHALDVNYATALGVNVDELLISQPDSGEQALETVEALIDSGAVSLIAVDSVAALVPQAELDGEMGDSNIGLQARLMSQAMRKLRGKAAVKGVTIIFINQIREKIGVMFGSPETTTGGRALKFYSTVRFDTRKSTVIKDGDAIIGHQMKIKVVKNKVGVPFKEVFVDLIYGVGIDKFKDLIEYAIKLKIVEKAGAWYSFEGERFQGLTKFIEYAKTNTTLIDAVHKEIERLHDEQKKVN